ncbi:MAG: hypothetical protein WKF50_10480 [Nocardioides sp.]
MTATPVRLIPRWYTAIVVVMLFVLTGIFTGLALSVDGVMGWSAWGLVLFAGLLLVAALSALARPRRVREPAVCADGTRVFLAPMLTVAALLGAWFAALAVAALWGFVALTDFDALESPGFSLVTIVGALASLPDLARLLTGRLHRWRLELGPESISYRGYRTAETWPWAKVHGARIQARGPAGVAIDVKGAGEDPVVPITAFAVPAEQLIEEIQRAKAAARR